MSELDRVDVVQPASWAVMVSLAALWRSAGVRPAAVVGHSQGEIAAAVVAGGLSLSDGARVVALRSKVVAELAGDGGMVSVAAPLDEVRQLIGPGLSIAAVNGPAQVVVAGDAAACDAFVVAQAERGARRIAVDYASHSAHVEAIRARLMADLAEIRPAAPVIPMHSTVDLATPALDADYWYRNLRQTVRFGAVVAALVEAGHRGFVEVSAHPVLVMAVAQAGDELAVTGTLRRDDGGRERWLKALGAAFVGGAPVDWRRVAGPGRAAGVPTYPFQHERYWAKIGAEMLGDLGAAGLRTAGHPLLGAAVPLADGDGLLLTGRLSLAAQPWLGDHAMFSSVLLPGTAFLEIAVHAGDQVGCAAVEELTLQAPLVLPEHGGVQLQVRVGDADESGRRPIDVYARPDGSDDGWTRHATGTLSAGFEETRASPEHWPPAGAQPVAVDGFYDRLAADGYAYGPAFRCLRAVWQAGDDVYAEVTLADDTAADGYGLHPAVLDAALHPVGLTGLAGDAGAVLAFGWSGVRLHATGARALRVRLTPAEGGLAVAVFDTAGRPVLSAASLVLRPISAEQPADAATVVAQAMFTVEQTQLPPAPAAEALAWARLGETGTSGEVPPVVVAELPAADPDATVPETVRSAVTWTLGRLQEWLADPATLGSRLVVRTRGATGGTDLAAAAVRGLMRSAQSEHPGRFVVLDVDAEDDGLDIDLGAVLAAGEPEIVVRGGTPYGRRLRRVGTEELADRTPALDPGGTVVVTGGTGVLGALIARHLVTAHGVRHLLLLSRRGSAADGAAELIDELREAGAHVQVEPCDAGDRTALAAALGTIPAGHPATGVVHTAGVIDDATVELMTPEQVATVLRAKADAAWWLHELTAGHDLAFFVMYSSAAATFGGPGVANYSAANAMLDALAERRHADGLPGQSLAWGWWAPSSAISDAADASRMTRSGIAALTAEQGLALFDAALRADRPQLVPIRLDVAGLRRVGAEAVPPLFRALAGGAGRRSAAPASARVDLTGLGAEEREQALLTLVRSQAAVVLGHAGVDTVDARAVFRELGFDSLTAVEFRNRLAAATGLRLPATLIFEHPSVNALTGYLSGAMPSASGAPAQEGGRLSNLAELYLRAEADGTRTEFFGLMRGLAAMRPSFGVDRTETAVRPLDRVATGPAPARLYLFTPYVAPVLPYMQLSAAFQGRRDVRVVHPPGFRNGEEIPADLEALVHAYAETIVRDNPEGAEFALGGASSAGMIAHWAGRELARRGIRPAGVILWDTPSEQDMPIVEEEGPSWEREVSSEIRRIGDNGDDSWLSAMAHYLAMPWLPAAPSDVPTLQLRATERLSGITSTEDWKFTWPYAGAVTLADVPGDHLRMCTEFAAESARAVDAWLALSPEDRPSTMDHR